MILVDKDGVCSWDDYPSLDAARAGIDLILRDYNREVHHRGSVVKI